MRAVVLRETGPADNLRLEPDWPDPQVTPGHVIVRVRAAGVCHRDVIDRRGGFPYMKRPVIPGHEIAGEVVAVGAGVDDLAAGDRVVTLHRAACGQCEYCLAGHTPRCLRALFMYGLTADGGYAEYVLAPAASLVPLPAEVLFEQGCFLACTAGIALRGMRTHGGLQAGQTLLVTGASGGVGLHALQVGRALGARTIGVTSSEDKAGALREYGADEVIVSRDLAFHKEVKRLTGGGAHVALDCVGAPTLNAAVRGVRPMGRVVVAGNVTVEHTSVNPGYLILNEVALMGTSGCTRDDLAQILSWVVDGTVRPVLAEVLRLDDAAAAHRRLEERGVTGRLVLVP